MSLGVAALSNLLNVTVHTFWRDPWTKSPWGHELESLDTCDSRAPNTLFNFPYHAKILTWDNVRKVVNLETLLQFKTVDALVEIKGKEIRSKIFLQLCLMDISLHEWEKENYAVT